AVPGAESEAALYERALAAWTYLAQSATERNLRTLVVVTHGGFMQWIVRTTFGCRTWFPLLPVHNCGMFRCKVEPVPGKNPFFAWEGLDEPLSDLPAASL
ncbi:MAG: histidine phosphatase family protein, partial [Termitinemataceae bacterium]